MAGCAPEPIRCPDCGADNLICCTEAEDRDLGFTAVWWCRRCRRLTTGQVRETEPDVDPKDGASGFEPGSQLKVRLMGLRRKRKEALCHRLEFSRAAARIGRALVALAEHMAQERRAAVALRLKQLRQEVNR